MDKNGRRVSCLPPKNLVPEILINQLVQDLHNTVCNLKQKKLYNTKPFFKLKYKMQAISVEEFMSLKLTITSTLQEVRKDSQYSLAFTNYRENHIKITPFITRIRHGWFNQHQPITLQEIAAVESILQNYKKRLEHRIIIDLPQRSTAKIGNSNTPNGFVVTAGVLLGAIIGATIGYYVIASVIAAIILALVGGGIFVLAGYNYDKYFVRQPSPAIK